MTYIQLCELEQSLMLQMVNQGDITLTTQSNYTISIWYSNAWYGVNKYSQYLLDVGYTPEEVKEHSKTLFQESIKTILNTEKVEGVVFPDGQKWAFPPTALQNPEFNIIGQVEPEEEWDNDDEPFEIVNHVIQIESNGRKVNFYLTPHETNTPGEPALFDCVAEEAEEEDE